MFTIQELPKFHKTAWHQPEAMVSTPWAAAAGSSFACSTTNQLSETTLTEPTWLPGPGRIEGPFAAQEGAQEATQI